MRGEHVTTGRPMKGYVFVEGAGIVNDVSLQEWLDSCVAYVGTLPKNSLRQRVSDDFR